MKPLKFVLAHSLSNDFSTTSVSSSIKLWILVSWGITPSPLCILVVPIFSLRIILHFSDGFSYSLTRASHISLYMFNVATCRTILSQTQYMIILLALAMFFLNIAYFLGYVGNSPTFFSTYTFTPCSSNMDTNLAFHMPMLEALLSLPWSLWHIMAIYVKLK